jgi:putative membrane protein (TIGR04086 family)
LAGALFGVKRAEKGAIKGLIWGVGYALVSFVLFSILSGRLDFGQFSLVDTAFCALAGIISGIIAVNVKK